MPVGTRFEMAGIKAHGLQALSVFHSPSPQNALLRRSHRKTVPWLRSVGRLTFLGITLLGCSLGLLADTAAMLRRVPAAGCYCHCAESRLRSGCIKMCDSKRYASRWWAKTCAKPHMQTPANNSNAGPTFPHPGRAEHAKL